jgi:hypothetical protein
MIVTRNEEPEVVVSTDPPQVSRTITHINERIESYSARSSSIHKEPQSAQPTLTQKVVTVHKKQGQDPRKLNPSPNGSIFPHWSSLHRRRYNFDDHSQFRRSFLEDLQHEVGDYRAR